MDKKPDIRGAKTVKELAHHVDWMYNAFIYKMNNFEKHQSQLKVRLDITITLLFIILSATIAGAIN